jgi:hypothetical protein
LAINSAAQDILNSVRPDEKGDASFINKMLIIAFGREALIDKTIPLKTLTTRIRNSDKIAVIRG